MNDKKRRRKATVVTTTRSNFITILLVYSERIQGANDKTGARVHPSCITCKTRCGDSVSWAV